MTNYGHLPKPAQPRRWLMALGLLLFLGAAAWQWGRASVTPQAPAPAYVAYRTDPRHLALYWHDAHGQPLRSLGRLRDWLRGRGQRLVFATNGGMYHPGNRPVGLFIQNGQTLAPLDTATGPGNFYLRPNGVFYLTTDGRAAICRTEHFRPGASIRYATQSGPLLVVDGRLHPAFRADSRNQHVRNGVGLLPDGRVVLAMSRQPVTFYAFARYFQRLGCRQALYLDGFVSRTYLPAQGWAQTDGDFGVIIGVSEPVR